MKEGAVETVEGRAFRIQEERVASMMPESAGTGRERGGRGTDWRKQEKGWNAARTRREPTHEAFVDRRVILAFAVATMGIC